LAEAQFWTLDFEGAAATCRKLKNLYPQTAEEVRTEADRLAEGYFSQHGYEAAARLAAQSLELKPNEPEPLATLAKAQFGLANFPAAAAAYRTLLDQLPSDLDFIRGYAEALSASGPTLQNAREFQAWAARVASENAALSTELRIQTAGLMLMAGNEAPAKELVEESRAPEHSLITPEALGRLGWWHYRAGNYEMSRVLLRQALAARPGDSGLQAAVAWDELQHQEFDSAIRHFTACTAYHSWYSPMMGRAVSRWQAHQTDDALKDFESGTKAAPEWRNPRWVKALLPQSVVESVAAMTAEWQKRQLAGR
jgi:tetratricopeptide (TPR) repeat protein